MNAANPWTDEKVGLPRRMKPIPCPCCGGLLDRPDPQKIVQHLHLCGIQLTVLRVLLGNFGRGVSAALIADHVYSGAAPMDSAEGCIKVHAYNLRKVLKPYGLTIAGKGGGGPGTSGTSVYRLDWIDAPALAPRVAKEGRAA